MTAALDSPALVLNKNWCPLHASTVKEAIALVAKGSAYIIEPGTYQLHDLASWDSVSRAKMATGVRAIRSQRLVLLPPEVIVLSTYDGLAERGVVFSRKNIFKRDRYTCMYCGAQPGPAELTIDHVKPKSKGGTSTWENCTLACVECNKKKANRTCDEAKMHPRKAPKKPSWKSLAQVPPRMRLESWNEFLSKAYWNIELEP